MSSSVLNQTGATFAPDLPPPGERVRFELVSWEEYESFTKLLGERPAVRVTYDRGEVEIMVTSDDHEEGKQQLSRLVEMLTYLLRIPVRSRGSMTFKRRDLFRGFEPDECYWIAHEPELRGRRYDPATDPPPDLAIEIEVSRSLVDRLGVYAAFGIPEIWRWDTDRLRIMLLNTEGQYVDSDQSLAFPFLPIHEFARFLTPQMKLSETDWLWQFQSWVQENAACNWEKQ